MNASAISPPVKLGLIGAGRWGRAYIQTIQDLPGIELRAIASRNPVTASLVEPSCVMTQDWHTLIARSDLDGVIIATPPALHAEMAEAAILSRKPVLVEKPLTMDIGQAERLLDLQRSQDGLVVVDHTHLFSPAFRELKRRSMSSTTSSVSISSAAGNRGPFRTNVPVLWDWASHDVAMILALLGLYPTTITARRTELQSLVDGIGESVAIELTFERDIAADIRVSNMLPRKMRRFEVRTDDGVWIYDDVGNNKLVEDKGEGPKPIALDDALPLTVAVEEFCRAINGATNGHKAGRSLALGVDVVRILADCQVQLDGQSEPT